MAATGTPTAQKPQPAGEAGLSASSADERSQARLVAGYVPFIDPVTARVYQRLQGGLALLWGPSRSWRLGANVGGGSVLNGVQKGQANLFGEARIAWLALTELEFAGGARVMAQWPAAGDPAADSVRQFVFFLAVNGHYRQGF